MAIADTIVIELFSEGDREYRPFGGLEKTTIFERLQKCNDITQIIVHYEDQTEEAYFTDWAEGDDCENKNQSVCKSDLGNLYRELRRYNQILDVSSGTSPSTNESLMGGRYEAF